jgi:hypothetical protein
VAQKWKNCEGGILDESTDRFLSAILDYKANLLRCGAMAKLSLLG